MLPCVVLQIDDSETDDDVKVLFNVDEAIDFLVVTGYRKAICNLGLQDKESLKAALLDYHCLLKVKAEMDQFINGLADVGVLEYVRKHPDLLKPLFTDCYHKPLTAGELICGSYVFMYLS